MDNQKKQRPLLEVKNLRVAFEVEQQQYFAVHGIDFCVHKGQNLGIIGESGCGKTLTALSLLRLTPQPVCSTEVSQIWFDGQRIDTLNTEEFRALRGKGISMIFQEPMSALNPIMTIQEQLAEVYALHVKKDLKGFEQVAKEQLVQVGLADTGRILKNYPHQLSGGQLQRVMIALCLLASPKLLIADEPTTALDLTIQAQILYLLQSLQQTQKMSILFITHDLGIIAQCCDYALVMYKGKIVEQAPVSELFANPKHPYTLGLIQTLKKRSLQPKRLPTIRGSVPNLKDTPLGCSFANRCDYKSSICEKNPSPQLQKLPGLPSGHLFACHHPV